MNAPSIPVNVFKYISKNDLSDVSSLIWIFKNCCNSMKEKKHCVKMQNELTLKSPTHSGLSR